MIDTPAVRTSKPPCRVAVIWIDWYAYHLARFQGLESAPELHGHVAGIELVGGVGVHAGLKFREARPADMAVETLLPDESWTQAGQGRLARLLWSRLSRLSPEVVLVPGYYTLPGIAAALWARLHGRVGVLMTESTAEDHGRRWWKEAFKGLLIQSLFDWAIAGGSAHVRYLRRLGMDADRIAGFYDVVDNGFFHHAASKLRQRSAAEFGLPQLYFLYVGRLAPEKNVEGLVTAWLAYRAARGTWPLVLVGDGPSAAALRTMVGASPDADHVIFAGLKGSAELPTYYAFAGCFVLPSTREPWGLVVNEAMASGLPVLVSSRCGCAEDLVVEGRNGFVFEPADTAHLARLLTGIASLNDAERGTMGAASVEIVSRFSPEGFGAEVARICKGEPMQGTSPMREEAK